LTIWRDAQKTAAEIERLSTRDGERYPDFLAQVKRHGAILGSMMPLPPPDPSGTLSSNDLYSWAKVGLKVRRLGKREMMAFLRVLPMSAKEFLDEWFENESLKGILGMESVRGSMQGPWASGTALMLLYQFAGEMQHGFVRGGVGKLSEALAGAARQFRAEIRTGAGVERILMENGKISGVALTSGEEIKATFVVSSADPRHTYFDLVGPTELPVRTVRRVKNIRFRGSTAAIHLALSGLPQFSGGPTGTDHLKGKIIINPGLEYLEKAYDDAKYGRLSQKPALQITIPTLLDPSLAPEGGHILSMTVRYAPYHLRSDDWDSQRKTLEERAIDTLSEFAPDLKKLILDSHTITPQDWEKVYGLAEGNIYHGQMGLDQLLFMRPIPGQRGYHTPIENLFLCGAGNHPGGGVMGAPGYNAAREILQHRK
jgi:phytoene dehydrogenase-like protein